MSTTTNITLIRGLEGSGKTTWLVNKATELLSQGIQPEDILVFAATPDAALVLRKRLVETAGAAAEAIRVTVPLERASETLSTPEAFAITGRKGRLLARFEESFFAEDLKVCGMVPKRIGSMLDFLNKGRSDRAYLDENWLIFQEERDLDELVTKTLTNLQAFLPVSATGAACDVLEAAPEFAQTQQVRYVFADDYTAMSRASQHYVRLVASDALFIAANPEACTSSFERYPYASGAEELEEAYPDITLVDLSSHLPTGQRTALENLSALAKANEDNTAFAATAPSPENLTELCATSPKEECAAVVEWIQERLTEGLEPSQIVCAVPNKTWERNISKALSAVGIPVRRTSDVGNISGNIRYLDQCIPAQIITLLTLVANEDDEAALRAWCGFGEYTTCRALFSEIYAHCEESGLTLRSALDEIHAAVRDGQKTTLPYTFLTDTDTVAQRIELLNIACEQLGNLRGMELVQAASAFVQVDNAAVVPQPLKNLCRNIAPEDSTTTVIAKIRTLMLLPQMQDTNAVTLTGAEGCLGLNAQAIILTGMVNGFSPKHSYFDRTKVSPEKARRMLVKEAIRMRPALSAPCVAISYFERIQAVDAEALEVTTERYFFEEGVRQSRVARSLTADALFGESVQPEQ